MEWLKRNRYNKVSGVYIIINTINGKLYVGSSMDLYERSKTHAIKLKNKKHYSKHLMGSVQKYGIENFKLFCIEECPVLELETKEQFWIDLLQVNNPDYGYNKRLIASNNSGYKMSEDVRLKMKAYYNLPEVKAKTKQNRQKLADARFTPELRKEYSQIMKDRIKSGEFEKYKEKWRKGIDDSLLAYLVFHKDGDVFYTKNLTQFCKDNNINQNRLYKTNGKYPSSYYVDKITGQRIPRFNIKMDWKLVKFHPLLITPQMRVIAA